MKTIWESTPDVLDDEWVNKLYEILKERRNVDAATKEAHVDNIHQRYKPQRIEPPGNPVPASKPVAVQSNPGNELLCPKCGSALVLRTAKRGNNAGGQFYGCSAYPKCRFIINLNESKAEETH